MTVTVNAVHDETGDEYEAVIPPGFYLLITHGGVHIDPADLPRDYKRVALTPKTPAAVPFRTAAVPNPSGTVLGTAGPAGEVPTSTASPAASPVGFPHTSGGC